MKTLRTFFIVLVLAFGAATGATGAHAQGKGEPQASSQDILRYISQARGKVVVLNFWASWCGPCRQEIPELMDLRKRIPESKLVIMGVSVDQDPAMFAMYAAKTGFNYPVYLARADVSQAFSIRAIPRTIVYSPKGEVIHSQEGYMPGPELEKLVKKHMGA
jgi:thiol-disulfide isomerase/thioredoxin